MSVGLALLIGVFFGLVASLMALLIIYEEYQKHRLGRWRLWKQALSAGGVTLVVFVILSLMVAYWAAHLSQ